MDTDDRYHRFSSDKAETRVGRRYAAGAVSALLAVLAFVGGVAVGEMRAETAGDANASGQTVVVGIDQPSNLGKKVDFSGFWNVWEIVRSRSVHQPVDPQKMYYGAVAGMVASLDDPYSIFLDPEIADAFESELSGTFDGIGAEIGIKRDQLKIIAPLPGTPAERAGLMAGDAILSIDGTETYGMSTDEAVRRIRGQKGTTVKLLISRDGGEPKEYEIVRDTIVVESVRWRIEERDSLRYAVIEIRQFNETTRSALEEAIQTVLLENTDGLILDLRNNPGGFLDVAVDVAGEWILRDVVVQEKFSDGSIRNHMSDGNARLADMPTVVLVNGGSASASEIVAGALQWHGKAKVVGEQTFGKGSVQDYMEFDDGSALKLTIALWLTPNGTSIEQQGITPDVVVELSEDDFNQDLDPQMDKAIEVLKAHGVGR